ncbi:MAG TPA: molybdopterin cofactor-binding domain-containing protein [Thermoanaerobaculia bacterium]|nr:molybdopterin cofactor-binding domain-containing protein [Thermoanaerobaculia bacterium]
MSDFEGIDRRRFFQLTGGGIAVFISLGPWELFGQQRAPSYPEDINAYLLIGADGRVKIFSGKIEMGQGVMTSQAQMAAEELGVAVESIDMVLGDTERCPWDMGTFGSMTTRFFGPALRAAAAEARQVLEKLAAEKLGVDPGRLVVEKGVVSVAGDAARKVTYGELAQGKRIARLVDRKAVMRAASQFEVMGKSPRRIDGLEKVTGRARYAADVRPPGMLYARVVRPPAHGAKLAALDVSAAEKTSGVTVVNQDGLVAVLHPDPEGAEKALNLVKSRWDLPSSALDPETIFDHIVKTEGTSEVRQTKGDVAAGRAAAARVFETTYRKGYVAHAPIEPHAAVAEFKDGKMTVWASTQTPFPTRDRIAGALKLEPARVRVVTPFLGGGFGGKSADLQAIEAARLAQITGKPVQVAWTRQEEFFYDRFDPAAVVEIVSGLDDKGKVVLWDAVVHAAGARGASLFYDIPNVRVKTHGQPSYGADSAGAMHLFSVGPWRAPGANMNAFAMESQMDLMAAAAGVDPLEFRLRHLTDPRMRRVLQAAADAFGWKSAPGPSGMGRAVACSVDAGSYDALIAQVRIDAKGGSVTVERIVCAQDMGIIVNPDGAKMQMEGSITMGLGYALAEELRFRGGDILDRNFGTYSIPRFSWVPSIETVLVQNNDLAPQGGGEPAIVATGAALANAVFDATGARIARLPMTPERLREGIAAAKSRRSAAG